MPDIRQIHVRNGDNEMYEVVAILLPSGKVAIQTILVFHGGNEGRVVKYKELDPHIQTLIINSIQEEYE